MFLSFYPCCESNVNVGAHDALGLTKYTMPTPPNGTRIVAAASSDPIEHMAVHITKFDLVKELHLQRQHVLGDRRWCTFTGSRRESTWRGCA